MERQQINLRLPVELAEAIDRKRIELQAELGRIPSRSEVMRLALDAYLTGQPGPTSESDRKSD